MSASVRPAGCKQFSFLFRAGSCKDLRTSKCNNKVGACFCLTDCLQVQARTVVEVTSRDPTDGGSEPQAGLLHIVQESHPNTRSLKVKLKVNFLASPAEALQTYRPRAGQGMPQNDQQRHELQAQNRRQHEQRPLGCSSISWFRYLWAPGLGTAPSFFSRPRAACHSIICCVLLFAEGGLDRVRRRKEMSHGE